MKIAYIANSRFPSEKAQSDHVMAMCAAFASQGHEVKLFVPDRKPVMAQDPFVYYGKPATFSFERVPCLDGLRWPWLGHLGLWIQTFSFSRALRQRLAAFAPDVVYSRELYVFAFGKTSGHTVWESHAVPASSWALRVMQKLDGIVTLTHASQERIVARGISSDHLLVEPDAVDPLIFANAPSREYARQSLNISPDERVCLYVGKFTTMGMPKGLDEAIEAVIKLRKEGVAIRLLGVGGTEQELVQYEKFKQEGIILLGHQPQNELKRFYAAADILLMPFPHTEHYAYFMSPLKLFEYLMSGIPMIVTDLPSVREIVTECEAYITEPGNVAKLAQTIQDVLLHPEEARVRAKAAKELSSRYTWQERARRIANWISKL